MKIFRPVYIVVLFSLSCLSCSRGPQSEDKVWGSRSPEVDSLTVALERAFFRHMDVEDPGYSMRLVARLESIASASDDRQLKDRAAYFKGRALMRIGRHDEGSQILSSLQDQTDSAANPYLYNRLLQLTGDYSASSPADYQRLSSTLSYFEKKGDRLMTAAMQMELGCFLKDIRDPRGALAAFDVADSLFRLCGYENVAQNNAINRASALFVAEDTVQAKKILYDILDSPAARKDPQLQKIVLHNLFGYANDTTALRRLAEMETDDVSATELAFFSRDAQASGDIPRAFSLVRRALQAAEEEEDADAYDYSLYTLAFAFEAAGKLDSAYYYLKEAVALNDEITIARDPERTGGLETLRMVSAIRMQEELKRSQRLGIVAVIFSGVFILLVIAAWMLRARTMRLKMQRLESKVEREKILRKLMAANIIIDQKNAVIKDVDREIKDLRQRGDLSAKAERVVSPVKIHNATLPERESFMDLFSSLHPDFASRLREKYPRLTESDLRIASYIAIGLDTRQLASTLGIRAESVKQARWRIRSKMELKQGESLERILAEFIS